MLPYPITSISRAIQVSQEGQYVFVVGKDMRAEMRPVVSPYSYDHESLIEKGVSPGEIVVTDGQLELINGSRVQLKNSLDAGNTHQ